MRRFLGIIALALVAACGADSSTNLNSDSIAGTYSLKSMNGASLPFTFQAGSTSIVILTDVLTVAEGGTWSEVGTYRSTVNGQSSNQTISDGGTWTRVGSSVSFYSQSQSSVSYSGNFTGSGFALSDAEFSYSFSK